VSAVRGIGLAPELAPNWRKQYEIGQYPVVTVAEEITESWDQAAFCGIARYNRIRFSKPPPSASRPRLHTNEGLMILKLAVNMACPLVPERPRLMGPCKSLSALAKMGLGGVRSRTAVRASDSQHSLATK
jgi:hypothetical protein